MCPTHFWNVWSYKLCHFDTVRHPCMTAKQGLGFASFGGAMIRVQGVRGLKDCIYYSPYDDDVRAATDAAFTWLSLGKTTHVVWLTMQVELCDIDEMGKPVAASVRRRHVAGPKYMEESVRRASEALWSGNGTLSVPVVEPESAESNNMELATVDGEAYSPRFVFGTDVTREGQQFLERHEISAEDAIFVEDLL